MRMQVQRARAENVPIRIQLPDGSEKAGVRGVTTPQDILQQLPRSMAKKAVVAKVDERVWDMFVPLEGDCNLQILTFEDPEGKEVSTGSCRSRQIRAWPLSSYQVPCVKSELQGAGTGSGSMLRWAEPVLPQLPTGSLCGPKHALCWPGFCLH